MFKGTLGKKLSQSATMMTEDEQSLAKVIRSKLMTNGIQRGGHVYVFGHDDDVLGILHEMRQASAHRTW
jgi:hypothetical protein